MTLPCADEANMIFGESFREFLAIGCRSGYFSLEQLTYQREEYIHFLESHRYEEDADDSEKINLKKIESTFDLKSR